MSISVRSVRSDDIIGVSNILNEIIVEGGKTLHNNIMTPLEFEKYYLKSQFSICCHVAIQAQSIIGFQLLEWSDPNWSGVDKLPSNWGLISTYIKKNARRLSAGRQLFHATKLSANKTKMLSIIATVGLFNKGAIEFYESLGFYEYEQFKNDSNQYCVSKRFDLPV